MWRNELLEKVQPFTHPAWGMAHSERVYTLSLEIAENEGLTVNEEALFAAAYLHDMGTYEPFKTKGVDHTDSAVKHYAQILQTIHYPKDTIPMVGEIIKGHMFYSKPAHSAESRVFHDADTLDFMGAVGIARILAIVGIDDWTPDLESAIALIEQFSKELPMSLHYSYSKKKGQQRVMDMKAFLEAFKRDAGKQGKV